MNDQYVTRFWIDDTEVLFHEYNQIFPHQEMSQEQQLNALTRALLIVSLILLIVGFPYWPIILFGGLLIILLLAFIIVDKQENYGSTHMETTPVENLDRPSKSITNIDKYEETTPVGKLIPDTKFIPEINKYRIKSEKSESQFRRNEDSQNQFRDKKSLNQFRRNEDSQNQFRRNEDSQNQFRRNEDSQNQFRRNEDSQNQHQSQNRYPYGSAESNQNKSFYMDSSRAFVPEYDQNLTQAEDLNQTKQYLVEKTHNREITVRHKKLKDLSRSKENKYDRYMENSGFSPLFNHTSYNTPAAGYQKIY